MSNIVLFEDISPWIDSYAVSHILKETTAQNVSHNHNRNIQSYVLYKIFQMDFYK